MYSLADFDLSTISASKLGEILIEAKKTYYTTGRPIMDDHTYDTLEAHLRSIAPHHRIFTKVGTPHFDTGWNKKNHTIPMGSQNKVTSHDELVHYFELKLQPLNLTPNQVAYLVQPKCDGLSVELEYQHGILIDAITRGDGLTGDVITQNVVLMKNFHNNLPGNFTGSIRCEIVVTKSDFAQLPSEYSNPRNAASGISQRLDSKYSSSCTLIPVDIIPNLDNLVDEINLIKSLGFTPIEYFECQQLQQVQNIFQKFFEGQRNSYPYDIDGLVVKISERKIYSLIDAKNNRPGHQVAYKFPASTDQTVVKKIDWQVGPMGLVTPVVNVEPIEISGAVIEYASLGNYDLVKKLDINIGDIIEISRRGDVIPHVEKVISKVSSGHIDIPQCCPSCHTKLKLEDKFLRCPNPKCLPQLIGSLNLFCQTLEILGLSSKTIEKLYTAGKVILPGDFYRLTIEDISQLDNLGVKSAQNILNQINSKKQLTLVQVFDAAIIPDFSARRVLQLIKVGFDTPQKLLNLTLKDLLSIKGFKSTLAQKIITGISLRRPWIESILSQVTIKKNNQNNILQSQNFCITGSLARPRKDIEDLIVNNGGSVQSTVTKNTTYLLTNDTQSSSSKFLAAQKLGIKIINENDFYQLIGQK